MEPTRGGGARLLAAVLLAFLLVAANPAGAKHKPKPPVPDTTDVGDSTAVADSLAASAPAPDPDAAQAALATRWKYRFDMTSPQNDKFAVTDRYFYLYFRPDTSAVRFQVQNRRGVAARILWDECTFTDTDGRTTRALHRGITYDKRDAPQAPSWVQPNQTYADFLIPAELLQDPNAAVGGAMRELLPTDLRARSMAGKTFGCRLVIEFANDNIKDTYDCTFKIENTFRDQ